MRIKINPADKEKLDEVIEYIVGQSVNKTIIELSDVIDFVIKENTSNDAQKTLDLVQILFKFYKEDHPNNVVSSIASFYIEAYYNQKNKEKQWNLQL